MATTSKLSFRARNLDANKGMCVFFASQLPDLSECAPIARAVAQMPTGMEKEEEMESHLQDAILAQQASTSGVRVDNHVIPTPKVLLVTLDLFDQLYPAQPPPSKNSLIKVQAWLALDKEEAEYDIDSEDESWLSKKPHIDFCVFERIFDTLESKSSDNNICLPDSARNALLAYDETVIDDVYDYWLAKREKSTTVRSLQLGVGGLIPRVRTECRKDQQGGVNPYVAFRRRAEKMQTRKNRKNDEDSYEKVLKLGLDLQKTVTLFDMVKRREKTKIALINLDSEILAHRMGLLDFGSSIYSQFIAKLKESNKHVSPVVNGVAKSEDDPALVKKKIRRRRMRTVTSAVDREVPSKAWLKKNAEVWNRPPSIFASLGISTVTEVEQSAQAASDASLDGIYAFKRRRGCIYRSPLAQSDVFEDNTLLQIPNEHHVYETFLPRYNGDMQSYGLTRRRLGRGGRCVFDRFRLRDSPRVPQPIDPFLDGFVHDATMSFRARLIPWQAKANVKLKFQNPSDHVLEEECERRWLNSCDSPILMETCDFDQPTSSCINKTSVDDHSGNGLAGRVDLSTPISTKEYGTVTVLDEWREESGSPSESNSSSEWVLPSMPSQTYTVLTTEGEARTGDHPIAKQPPVSIKGCVITPQKFAGRTTIKLRVGVMHIEEVRVNKVSVNERITGETARYTVSMFIIRMKVVAYE